MREVGTQEPRQEEEVEEVAIEPLEELIEVTAFSEAFGIFGQWDGSLAQNGGLVYAILAILMYWISILDLIYIRLLRAQHFCERPHRLDRKDWASGVWLNRMPL